MNMKPTILLLTGIMLISVFVMPAPVSAQLSQDVRDVFNGLLDDLEDDLRAKFEDALEKDSPIVEFNRDEFERFRASPANPFEGINQIDPKTIEGSIQLRFELPSLRNRPIDKNERQSRLQLRALRPAVGSTAASTARVFLGNRHVAMGMVVDAKGLLITKASEIQDKRIKKGDKTKVITCELLDGRRVVAKIMKVDERNDVALLKIKATSLTPVQLSNAQPLPGTFVITPGAQGQPISLGTYSNVPRSTVGGKQAFLGVKPQAVPQGVQIFQITPDTAAAEAGLQNGDILTSIDGIPLQDVPSLVNEIRKHRAGDQVELEFIRAGSQKKVRATLAGRNVGGERAKRFKMMNRLGAVLSRRGDDFPVVFQHDSPLFPEQCGGPIVDLEGNVLGMNIARNGRAATLAIPSNHLQTILDDLLREDIAKRND